MVLRGGLIFEEKILPSVRTFYPCIHSRDFYRISSSDMASCSNRGGTYHSFGLHDDTDLIRRYYDESSSNETSEIFARNNKSNIQNKVGQGKYPCLTFVKINIKNLRKLLKKDKKSGIVYIGISIFLKGDEFYEEKSTFACWCHSNGDIVMLLRRGKCLNGEGKTYPYEERRKLYYKG